MSESDGLRLDSGESEAVCRAVVKALGERHQRLGDLVADTSDFEGASDPAGRRAQEFARLVKDGLNARRLSGAAEVVGTLRAVFTGVAQVRETDFEAEYGIKAVVKRIDGAGA